jgi:hypothetical protein
MTGLVDGRLLSLVHTRSSIMPGYPSDPGRGEHKKLHRLYMVLGFLFLRCGDFFRSFYSGAWRLQVILTDRDLRCTVMAW